MTGEKIEDVHVSEVEGEEKDEFIVGREGKGRRREGRKEGEGCRWSGGDELGPR